MSIYRSYVNTWESPALKTWEKAETIPGVGNVVGLKYIIEGIVQIAKAIFERAPENAIKGLKDFAWGLFLQIPILSNVVAATKYPFLIIRRLAEETLQQAETLPVSAQLAADALPIATTTHRTATSSHHPKLSEITQLFDDVVSSAGLIRVKTYLKISEAQSIINSPYASKVPYENLKFKNTSSYQLHYRI